MSTIESEKAATIEAARRAVALEIRRSMTAEQIIGSYEGFDSYNDAVAAADTEINKAAMLVLTAEFTLAKPGESVKRANKRRDPDEECRAWL